MMKVVGKLGKILGTRGSHAQSKVGTVTMDIGKAIKELKKGKLIFGLRRAAFCMRHLGKLSL